MEKSNCGVLCKMDAGRPCADPAELPKMSLQDTKATAKQLPGEFVITHLDHVNIVQRHWKGMLRTWQSGRVAVEEKLSTAMLETKDGELCFNGAGREVIRSPSL